MAGLRTTALMSRVRRYLSGLSLASATLLSACVSGPQVISLAPAGETQTSTTAGEGEYREVLAAIASVMAGDLSLPGVEGSVVFFPDRQSFRSGVIAESQRDDAQRDDRLAGGGASSESEPMLFFAQRSAAKSLAVALNGRVLVDAKQLRRLSWWERVQILAHELTHTVERVWVEGRTVAWHRWLSEGFAEWTGHRVVEKLGGPGSVESSVGIVAEIAKQRQRQASPPLTSLATGENWLHWLDQGGRPATYGQAFLAVDWLMERKGMAAIARYFRLFENSRDRDQNFLIAFGEPPGKFAETFDARLQALIGR